MWIFWKVAQVDVLRNVLNYFSKIFFCEFNTFVKFQVNMLRQYYYKRFFKTQTEKQINGKLSKIGHTFIGTFPWFLLST